LVSDNLFNELPEANLASFLKLYAMQIIFYFFLAKIISIFYIAFKEFSHNLALYDI